MDLVPQLAVLIFLLLLNGFFVASEIILIATRRSKVDELIKKESPTAKLLAKALDHLDLYISATQLGVTIVGLMLGWSAEPLIADRIGQLLQPILTGPFHFLSHVISFVISFGLITFLSVVVGEIVPKTIALQRTELVASIFILPLSWFTSLLHPFIRFLNISSRAILRILRIDPDASKRLEYSQEEIRMILEQIGRAGTMASDEVEILKNAMKLGNTPIKNMLMPRQDLIAFDGNMRLGEVFSAIGKYSHSRYPVYKKEMDNILGFIHVKDIYRSNGKIDRNRKLIDTDIIRETIRVPESRKANEVLLDMRRKQIHLAVVYDEFGGMSGIVTLEDIIESVVGDIQDEFDKPIKMLHRKVDGSYIIDGKTAIDTIRKKFNMSIKGGEYTTIGGYVFGVLGREPRIGDKIVIGRNELEVLLTEGTRINRLVLKRKE